jgi:hypothetical protein
MPGPARKVRVAFAYRPEYPDPIQVTSGETVAVGREDDEFPGWSWYKASDGGEGWIPVELLSSRAAHAVVLAAYSAKELAVERGEELVVEDARHGWLLVHNRKGEHGWIPQRNTEPLEE